MVDKTERGQRRAILLTSVLRARLDGDDPNLAPALSALDRIAASAPAFRRQPGLSTGQASTGHSLPGARVLVMMKHARRGITSSSFGDRGAALAYYTRKSARVFRV
jgi:hypothetical protein